MFSTLQLKQILTDILYNSEYKLIFLAFQYFTQPLDSTSIEKLAQRLTYIHYCT